MVELREKVNSEVDETDDPALEKIAIIFLIVFILAVIFIPSDLLLKWSMWWNNIK